MLALTSRITRGSFGPLVLLGAVLVAAPSRAAAQQAEHAPPLIKVVDTAWIDSTTKACNDFFDYANGAWIRNDTIPAAYSSSGVTRDMSDANELVVRSVLDDAAAARAQLPHDSTEWKLGTFYASCMDSTAIEAAGIAPIRPWLAEIDRITTRPQLVSEIAKLQVRGLNVAFRFGPDVDNHDAEHYIASFFQGGLGLPDRDYYTTAGASSDSTRQAYVAHLTRQFVLAGESRSRAAHDADQVMALETEMAKASMQRVAMRDPAATDHPMTMRALDRLASQVQWPRYFRSVGLTHSVAKVNVGVPDFLRRVSQLIATAPLAQWKAYLRAHLISESASWLSSPFVNEAFAFSSRFSGAKQLLPRWKRCLREADGDLGEALGQAYVAKTFPPEAKARAKAVIEDVRAAFRVRLQHLAWMSDTTRVQALDKLDHMGEKVGYPDHWRDYGKLVTKDGPFVLNVARANEFEWRRTINRPGQAVDKTEWGITVPTVNA